MIWKIRLHDDLAAQGVAASASCDLLEQREQSLGRAEIRAVERVIGAKNAHQCQTREVVPLGEHLRTDQDVYLASGDLSMHVCERSPPPRRIAVDTEHARFCELAPKRILEPLRAVANREEVAISTTGTGGGDVFGVPAVVATQAVRFTVHDETGCAARAHRLPCAGRA